MKYVNSFQYFAFLLLISSNVYAVIVGDRVEYVGGETPGYGTVIGIDTENSQEVLTVHLDFSNIIVKEPSTQFNPQKVASILPQGESGGLLTNIHKKVSNVERKTSAPNYESLKMELGKFLETVPFNGIISVRGKNGEQIYEKHIGYVALNDSKKGLIDSSSEFGIGSTSKHMLSTLALMQQENNILHVDTPIERYIDISSLGMSNLTPEQKKFVTLSTLLSMTSGLQASDDPGPKPFRFDAKDQGKFIYANESYTLAKQIIEKITGKEIAELYNNMFKQLGMNNTWLMNDANYDEMRLSHPSLVHGNIYLPTGSFLGYCGYCIFNSFFHGDENSKKSFYETFGRLKPDYSEPNNPFRFGPKYIYPEAAGVASTANDLHIWNHNLYSNNIISGASLAFLLNTGSDYSIPLELGRKGFYGLGMGTVDQGVYMVGGWVYGFSSWLFYFEKEKISGVILENIARVDNFNPDQNIHMSIASIIKKHITMK